MDKKSIIPSFIESLDPAKDIIVNSLEIPLDDVIENDLLKEIPLVKTIISVYKIGINLKERKAIKNTVSFINAFNEQTISEKAYLKYKEKIESSEQTAKEEVERVLLLIDESIDDIKIKFHARLFRAFVCEDITWDRFCELSEINRRLFLSDYHVLEFEYEKLTKPVKNGEVKSMMYDTYRTDRLASLGLMIIDRKKGEVITAHPHYVATDLGIDFIKYTK